MRNKLSRRGYIWNASLLIVWAAAAGATATATATGATAFRCKSTYIVTLLNGISLAP